MAKIWTEHNRPEYFNHNKVSGCIFCRIKSEKKKKKQMLNLTTVTLLAVHSAASEVHGHKKSKSIRSLRMKRVDKFLLIRFEVIRTGHHYCTRLSFTGISHLTYLFTLNLCKFQRETLLKPNISIYRSPLRMFLARFCYAFLHFTLAHSNPISGVVVTHQIELQQSLESSEPQKKKIKRERTKKKQAIKTLASKWERKTYFSPFQLVGRLSQLFHGKCLTLNFNDPWGKIVEC